jgi:excisionase family DNA binding protein
MNEQRLLTVREVAERLRSSPETVRRWLRQGKLRGFRPGGTKLGYRVPESELQRFINVAQRTTQGQQPPPNGSRLA